MTVTMKRVAWGLGLLPVAALVVALTQSATPQPAHAKQGEADKPVAKLLEPTPGRGELDQPLTGGVSTRTIAPQAMMVGWNGQYVRAYPKDCLKPFDATDWFIELPFAVERVTYDAKTRELLVAVSYGWNSADVDRFRETLVEKYRQAGRATESKAISIVPLEMTGYSILIRDGDRDHLAFSTAKPTSVSAETIAFRVPATEADTLHQRLSNPKTLPSVKVVLRAGYSFDRIVGLTVEKQAVTAVFQKLFDSVRPNDAAPTGQVLVNRKMVQELQKKAAAELVTVVKTYGIPSGEEAAELEKAKGVVMSVPVSPVTVLELLAMEESAWMYTLKAIEKDITPDEMNNALTKLREVRSRAEKVSKAAEAISKHANDKNLTLDQFYSTARKEALDAGGGGWGVSVEFHLKKDEDEVMKNHRVDIQKARAYTSNKTNFMSDVQEFSSRELEGVMNESKVTAKLLDLHRVSTAALTAQAGETYSYSRVTGRETVFSDTIASLAPSPVVADAVAALQEDVGRLRADLKRRDIDELGTMKPWLSTKLPKGWVLADGKSLWPNADWVPLKLRGQPVPHMAREEGVLIGGAPNEESNGQVFSAGSLNLSAANIDLTKVRTPADEGVGVLGEAYLLNEHKKGVVATTKEMGLNEPLELYYVKNQGPHTAGWKTIEPSGALRAVRGDRALGGSATVSGKIDLNSAATNPRHLMTRWIIKVSID